MVDDMADPDFTGLGKAVRQRREDLGLSLHAVRERGGPAVATLQKIEAGQPADYRTTTIRPLERALAWAPGSIQALLNREQPTEVQYRPATRHIDDRQSEEGGKQPDLPATRDEAVAQLVIVRSLIGSHVGAIDRIVESIRAALADGKPDLAEGLLESVRIIGAMLMHASDTTNPDLQRQRADLVTNYQETFGELTQERHRLQQPPSVFRSVASDESAQPTPDELLSEQDDYDEALRMDEQRWREEEVEDGRNNDV